MFNTERFNQLIEEKGFTDEALAEASGLTRQTIWLLRKGEGSNVMLSTLNKLAGALEVKASELMIENVA
jgi:DNA-binding Xre family transcriptional regulator